jgi:hypothetical protein
MILIVGKLIAYIIEIPPKTEGLCILILRKEDFFLNN